MKQKSLGSMFLIAAFWGALSLGATQAQDFGGRTPPLSSATPEIKQRDSVTTNAAAGPHRDPKAEPDEGRATTYSAGVDEVLRMVKAGVGAEVVKTYIDNSPIVYSLSADDIIALKQNAVPDDLTTAMVKRGAELGAQVRQFNNRNAMPPAYSGSNRQYQTLDPESYDYFHYYPN
ncbi:MAG: hypothetical protein NT154_39705 [Verrucomicrobia bacterium]|nr:hypothetical protein [Verrucomicrobiota bacterium]